MARRTTTVTREEVPDDDQESLLLQTEEDATPDEEALEGLLAEFTGGTDFSVNVYKQNEGANNIAFLFKTTPQEMTGGDIMEKVRDAYGSGDYRLHVRDGQRIVKNKGFSVVAPEKPDPGAVQQNNNLEMVAMMQGFLTSQATMFQTTMGAMAEAMKGREPPPPPDPIAMQTALINSLVAMKQIAAPETPAKDPVEMLVQGLTLAQQLNPKEGETNSTDVLLAGIKEFGPAIAQATTMGMNAPGAPGAPGAAPGGAPMMGPPGQPAAVDAAKEREMGIRSMLQKQQLNFLIKQAEAGKDPGLYAELLLDQIGAPAVLDFVGKEDCYEKLLAIEPAIEAYRPWFEALRTAILEITREDDDLTGDEIASQNGIEGELIPAEADTGAIPNAANPGHVSDTPPGSDGDTPNA